MQSPQKTASSSSTPRYPGKRVTTNGNQLVAATEALIAEAGVFYPITPSTEMGENYQMLYAKGQLTAFGEALTAIETEGEHAAQGGAIAMSVTGKRVVNFTSGQGLVYGLEQYYHAPGKLSTMVVEVGARALTKHALNVHCGHDDLYAALDTGWNILFAKDAQQAVDQAIILRKVNELSLNPGINAQDGFLTTHLERTFFKPEPGLIREFLGAKDDIIECPTQAQRTLFGPTRRRVPAMIDLKNPALLGPVQNQEHYMNGVAARRNNFSQNILPFFEQAYEEFGRLTGRTYGLISQYNCEHADTVFVALGSAAENIAAAVDYLKETRGVEVGVIHINVLRPFPENAVIKALKGKKNVIVLERTDEALSGDNPLTRDIEIALSKAASNFRGNAYGHLDKLDPATEMPTIISGVYGLGSRDFRPEGIIGAYDFAHGTIARRDGKKACEGANFFYLGIDHPYGVVSEETPSCLPAGSIAVRFHSIGGWGMITTGKNLGEILGEFSNYVAKREKVYDDRGDLKEVIHISANPKYGSEKKGAPTNYFLVAAPERVRVNCDLQHVSVVLCCDPKVFLHTDPLVGLQEGGAFVWESNESSPEAAWQRIPTHARKEIIEKNVQVYILNGFDIARRATEREDLQTRMQGNSFLGAFFKVSSLLKDYDINEEDFRQIVRNQYEKKFGRFGEAVVESNMTVMQEGFDSVRKVEHGAIDATDRSSFVGTVVTPCSIPVSPPAKSGLLQVQETGGNGAEAASNGHPAHASANGANGNHPLFKLSTFASEYRAGYGYNQPSSPLASVGIMAAASGAHSSKYVARREIPVFIEENCTQCMDCITICPDTALPNTAQDISTVLSAAIQNYVSDGGVRTLLLSKVPEIEEFCRARMLELATNKEDRTRFKDIVLDYLRTLQEDSVTPQAIDELGAILDTLPIAYKKSKAIFLNKEKKEPGSGGLFSIFVNDLCKGCAACVEACGDHQALKMVPETEEMHARYESATTFLESLQNTPQKYLGIFDAAAPQESKAAALKFHLMLQSKYKALVSGDGACAGCGEKSVLRAIATLTETLMRPIFHAKADRLLQKAKALEENGLDHLKKLEQRDEKSYHTFRKMALHLLMGYGGENSEDTEQNIQAEFKGTDKEIIDAIAAVMRQDAANHRQLQTIEGFTPEGMSVMAMAAHTGCNTVYGSTPPNNPHPYPWMNSLFQDGATIGWLIGESFIKDHARHSVIPERLADAAIAGFTTPLTENEYFKYTHFTDTQMTDDEIMELPKVWAIGGDGGMGDIGYQNVSKVVLQNRPNVKLLMLDTQVYSNTGGQNSDSSPMTGGFDMNQAGAASEGKLTEKKSVAETFLGGHGSPYVAQVSMANTGTLYKSLLDGLCYRGTAFYQVFTTCQPEHGVPDYAAQMQAQRIRDSRGMPEFICDPQLGETYPEMLSIKGNPHSDRDWYMKKAPVHKTPYSYTVAHWAFTEARFRFHHKKVKPEAVEGMIRLEDKLKLITMNDVVHRRYLDPNHRSFVPDRGVYAVDYADDGSPVYHVLSRQMVLFCVERRKAWRILQSRAGVVNKDYLEQKELLAKIDSGEWTVEEALNNGHMAQAESVAVPA
ncbi:MAG: 2-oxoacid:acceptor oxidoreductase family protein [bacterium]